MKLIIDQSMEYSDVEIVIKCGMIDEKLKRLIEQIQLYSFSITTQKNGMSYLLKLEDICYFESVDEKTFVYCEKDVYECNYKLYELEKQLENTAFVRISKQCIVNTTYVAGVKAMLNGKLEAHLENKESVIINRHYVQAFKSKFGL